MSDDSLQGHRDRWLAEVCASLLEAVAPQGFNVVDAVHAHEVWPELTAATLISQIAAELAGGSSREVVAGIIIRSGVLDPDVISVTAVLDLIDRVEWLLSSLGRAARPG